MNKDFFQEACIDMSRYQNSYRKHLHALKYEQFTENILMNQIFKTVVLNLVKKTTVKDNRMKLGQALLWLEDVEQIKITENIWNQVTFTRLNYQYCTVFNMAKLFYHNSSVNLNKGDELTFSFLVPLNQLFERYIFEMLKVTAEPDVCIKYQGPVSFLGYLDGKKSFQLKPDISIIKNEQVLMIFDAKYKEIIDAEGNNLVSQSDIYQMLAYSVKYHCNQIVLVYPKMLGCSQDKFELFTIEIPTYNGALTIRVVQVDLELDTGPKLSQFTSGEIQETP
jgi:5-methylcytosine-specific restriction enzyme subunit McrC